MDRLTRDIIAAVANTRVMTKPGSLAERQCDLALSIVSRHRRNEDGKQPIQCQWCRVRYPCVDLVDLATAWKVRKRGA